VQNPKTRVKSFRLHEELLETLRIAASRHGVTENTLVETFLTSRLRVDPILLAFDVISVGRETFMQIIGAANIDGLEAFAPTQGKKSFSLAKQLFASNDMQLSFFKYLTEILGERARWFHTEGTLVKPELITLYHPYGTKWSAFLKSFISGAYEVISRDKLKLDITNDFVSIQFPNPTTSL
jgi:hypothetical protein